ncbi:hypothetical protein D3C78_1207490 [compost metagenome]
MLDDAGHHRRRAAAAGDQPGKTQQPAPGQRRGAAKVVIVQADQGKHITGKSILGLRLEANVIAVLAPTVVQQGQQAMIEKVQERRANATLLGLFPGQSIEVIGGQWRVAAVQAKEGRLHPVARIAAVVVNQAISLGHIGGWKAEPRLTLQTDTATRRRAQGQGFEVIAMQGVQLLQQTVERIVPRVGQQRFG